MFKTVLGESATRIKGGKGILTGDYVPLIEQEVEESVPEKPSFVSKSSAMDSRVTQNPHDPIAWLEFARMQDDMLMDVSDRKRAPVTHMVNAKKAAILERALEYLENDDRILAEYMQVVQELWEYLPLIIECLNLSSIGTRFFQNIPIHLYCGTSISIFGQVITLHSPSLTPLMIIPNAYNLFRTKSFRFTCFLEHVTCCFKQVIQKRQ